MTYSNKPNKHGKRFPIYIAIFIGCLMMTQILCHKNLNAQRKRFERGPIVTIIQPKEMDVIGKYDGDRHILVRAPDKDKTFYIVPIYSIGKKLGLVEAITRGNNQIQNEVLYEMRRINKFIFED